MIITKGNDIYIYFELIKQLNPTSVLDVGMFLVRCGAVGRQAMGCEIASEKRLEGVRLSELQELSVYETVYQ